ncbi:hypothetical protein Patl1_19210 [Pistacia atlantica]|uniref:Uncharacterized protein n=1 Tax=Pistacia atlantica TaxID=434234 RepID=A0ACC1BY63_9ROSI|nr:hypothetical protein Patl1_19210 [Pistacia atlantica]
MGTITCTTACDQSNSHQVLMHGLRLIPDGSTTFCHPSPPPPPTPPSPLLPPPPVPAATAIHLNYPDSIDSSPRSRNNDTYDDPLPPVPGAKLRLMCSYGGHIIPRPHDKSLCYVGGDTRLVVVDRHSSLSSLCTRLSRSLLHGRSFTMKYQLPNEDLDSLVSITTEEDLENMIEGI